jgi:hypothetical protein
VDQLLIEQLRSALRYNPETGIITRAPHWKPVNIRANGISGASVELGGRRYSARRVVWALVNGEWPPATPGYIRVRNGDHRDLRWSNLYAHGAESHCARCDRFRPISEFYSRGVSKTGLQRYSAYCKPCTAERHAERPDYAHRAKVKRYGITTDHYAALLARQGGTCAICKRPPSARRLAVDHCHTTGKVRGLLCSPCNVSLGQFGDDPRRLVEAAKYLLLPR